ncbi:hypothetical protein FACS1894216_04970 [Synergistales bacterium]|nr:hypothetical protein FACS1894216_04970 [Synergistales bacterium]
MNELSAKSCAKLFDVNVATWYDWCQNDPTAPKPVHQAPRFTRWDEAEVLAYRDAMRAERRTGYGKRRETAA